MIVTEGNTLLKYTCKELKAIHYTLITEGNTLLTYI